MERKSSHPNSYEMNKLGPSFYGNISAISTLMTIQEVKLQKEAAAAPKTKGSETRSPSADGKRPDHCFSLV